MRLRKSRVIHASALLALTVGVAAYQHYRPAALPATAAPDHPGGARAPALAAPRNACSQMHRTICQKRGVTRDPTGAVKPDIAGELQALRAHDSIRRENPEWTSAQVDEELAARIYTAPRRKRLISAHGWVEQTLVRIISRQPETVFTPVEKKTLIARVRRTDLQLPPPASAYADEPELFTKNDVVYERTASGKLRMRVGGAYLLNSKSWFNLVFTLGHEFAHAIDPCELRAAGVAIPAYDRVSSCFMAQGLVAARATRRECGENDQLSETFADWIAVQVVSEALQHFSTEFHGPQLVNAAMNSVRDLCEQDDYSGDFEPESAGSLDFEFHPSPQVRIDQIFARNPVVREVLGCGAPTSGAEYCSFEYQPLSFPTPLTPPTPKAEKL